MKKKILIGSVLAALLILSMPMVSSVQNQQMKKKDLNLPEKSKHITIYIQMSGYEPAVLNCDIIINGFTLEGTYSNQKPVENTWPWPGTSFDDCPYPGIYIISARPRNSDNYRGSIKIILISKFKGDTLNDHNSGLSVLLTAWPKLLSFLK